MSKKIEKHRLNLFLSREFIHPPTFIRQQSSTTVQSKPHPPRPMTILEVKPPSTHPSTYPFIIKTPLQLSTVRFNPTHEEISKFLEPIHQYPDHQPKNQHSILVSKPQALSISRFFHAPRYKHKEEVPHSQSRSVFNHRNVKFENPKLVVSHVVANPVIVNNAMKFLVSSFKSMSIPQSTVNLAYLTCRDYLHPRYHYDDRRHGKHRQMHYHQRDHPNHVHPPYYHQHHMKLKHHQLYLNLQGQNHSR